MVPVDTGEDTPSLIVQVQEALRGDLRRLCEAKPVLKAFALWIVPGRSRELIDPERLAERALESEVASYQDVAVLGYLNSLWDVMPDLRSRFRERFGWLMGRSFFVPQRARGFEADSLAMLGVVLGAKEIEWSEDHEKLNSVLGESARELSHDTWDRSLVVCARSLLNGDEIPRDVRDLTPDLIAALGSHGYASTDPEMEGQARSTILTPEFDAVDLDRSIVRYRALDWLYRREANISPRRAGIDDVARLLAEVPNALRNWTWEESPRTRGAKAKAEKWDILHEYHVQNLLWAVLRPVFQDLEDEEWLASLGHKHPRADLAIPSLRLVIEVKFARSPSKFSDKIEEVAADASLYLKKGSRFDALIAFVWDNSRSTEEHGEFRRGLLDISGVREAIVVPRPGQWE